MSRFLVVLLSITAVFFLGSCVSLPTYQQADMHKGQIRVFAVLPLVVGDSNGRVEHLGDSELGGFVDLFRSQFYEEFERNIELVNGIRLLLPGRDFDVNVYNGMDLFAVAKNIGADAVLGINLTLYNEVKPGSKALQTVAAVATTLLFGGYSKENQIAGYTTSFAYLGIESVPMDYVFKVGGLSLPTIEEQRNFFIESLVQALDQDLPISTDYLVSY